MHRKEIGSLVFNEIYTLDEAKRYARVEHDDDDNFIESLIPVARRLIEQYCLISLVQHQYEVTYDLCDLCQVLQLQDQTLIASVEQFDVKAEDGTVTPGVQGTDYQISNNRLILYFDQDIYTSLSDFDVLTVQYTSGVELPTQALKDAHGKLIAHWYENREAVQQGSETGTMQEMPIGVASILSPYKNYAV